MHTILLVLVSALFAGSLLSLSSNPHWFVRGWEFPRIQIVVITVAILLIHVGIHWWITPAGRGMSWAIGILAASLIGWQSWQIFPYTPIAPNQAMAFDQADRKSTNSEDRHLRLLVSNVQLENKSYDLWRQTIQAADPDVIIAAEPDQQWLDALAPWIEQFPYKIVRPQDNYYGMMMLSRLAIKDHDVRFLVEDDVPSIDAIVELRSGEEVRVIGVHPRPPEPIRDNDATARDAELILWAKELEDETRPVIIGGDLNDVAWSQTTRLFLRTSGLLDPRRGRGLFNSFHADHWWMRFPLDHIFHSPHFRVRSIERLTNVGSDHFPILIDLQFAPQDQDEHEVLEKNEGDQEAAEEKIERAVEAEELDARPIETS